MESLAFIAIAILIFFVVVALTIFVVKKLFKLAWNIIGFLFQLLVTILSMPFMWLGKALFHR